MPRRKVEFRLNEYYHVYNRGHNRSDIFFERESYYFFLRKMREHLLGRVCTIVAYCLMPNHYHFLVQLLDTGFSDAMKTFGISYSKSINKRFDRVGPLFQGPFEAIHVDEEAYLLNLSRYIHLNPVIAGMAKHPEEWEFSSYPEFIGVRDGTLPQPETILREFPSVQAYRKFVEDGIGRTDETIAHLMVD